MRIAPKASFKLPLIRFTPDDLSFSAFWASGSLRGRKSGCSPGYASCALPSIVALRQTATANVLIASRIQKMPLAHD